MCAWLVIGVPILVIAHHFDPSLAAEPTRAALFDMAIGLAAVLAATSVFVFVLPRAIPPGNALLLDLTYAVFAIGASLCSGIRWFLPA